VQASPPAARLAAAGRPDQENITLAEFDFRAGLAEAQALVVVIHRHGEYDLGPILANHILVQRFLDLVR